ncbi:hypothetical protein JCGZ_25160 [Jatropha curcas]|uniref:B box-type domain-containing protein n=1 Tax=Jatropha curcas TaxID=180498 RepID=A0A067JLK9_JATCU|nr:hypothetical protein JCGZ_25160 [Jatropha curcas]
MGKYLFYRGGVDDHMEFGATDIGDNRVGEQIFTNPDGSILVKHDSNGKFWRATPNWIYPITTDASDSDPAVSFWPIKLEGNAIALRSKGNDRFLRRTDYGGTRRPSRVQHRSQPFAASFSAPLQRRSPESVVSLPFAVVSSDQWQVHICNKLASRHVRVGLANPSDVPCCDICENAPAFFYCEVDGSSLCLQCDVSVHVGGKRTHRRFLLLRQRVEFPGDSTVAVDPNLQAVDGSDEIKKEQNQHQQSNMNQTTKQSHLVLEELVKVRQIYNVEYLLDNATVYDESILTLARSCVSDSTQQPNKC